MCRIVMHVRRCLPLQAKWRERRDAARQERLARRQAGQQSDAVSNSTAAHSRSTTRQLGSARHLQSGAEPHAEPAGQEAQSARVSLSQPGSQPRAHVAEHDTPVSTCSVLGTYLHCPTYCSMILVYFQAIPSDNIVMTSSVQTPGGRENSNHRVTHQNGEVSGSAKAAPSAEHALAASSNGVQDPASASDVKLVSLCAHSVPLGAFNMPHVGPFSAVL